MAAAERVSMSRSLAVKALLLVAAGTTVLWLGWAGILAPLSGTGRSPVERHDGPSPSRIVERDGPSDAAPRRIDVNRASVHELTAVPGVGPVLAERIVSHRNALGPYTSLEHLLDVRGIGAGRLSRMRPSLFLSDDQSHPPPASARESAQHRRRRS